MFYPGGKNCFTGVVFSCGNQLKGDKSMMEVKTLFDQCQQSGWIPAHNCMANLKILEETHSVNSLHNIVIARKSKCKICSKIFEAYDPRGLK